jgi:hypothetical protein
MNVEEERVWSDLLWTLKSEEEAPHQSETKNDQRN